MKKPVLTMGILMLIVLFYDLSDRKKSIFHRDAWVPDSCRAAVVPLAKRVPGNWDIKCHENNLSVEIQHALSPKNNQDLKSYLFRELANDLTTIARQSSDNLEGVVVVRLKVIHPRLHINAVTQGKLLNKLKTLTSEKSIAEHIGATVKVQEVPQ